MKRGPVSALVALGIVVGMGLGSIGGKLTPVHEETAPTMRSAAADLRPQTTSRSGRRGLIEREAESGPRADQNAVAGAAMAVPEPGSGLLGTDPGAPTGTLAVVGGALPASVAGPVRTVRIEVEQGLPVDAQAFADAVMTTLNDPRGWSALDGIAFERTQSPDAEVRVVLAHPQTTDQLCAPLETRGTYSCAVETTAVVNFSRWVSGASDFALDTAHYRHYVVNHEVGHVLGHRHQQCPAPGALAPVMVQQTMSAQGCVVNGWPVP